MALVKRVIFLAGVKGYKTTQIGIKSGSWEVILGPDSAPCLATRGRNYSKIVLKQGCMFRQNSIRIPLITFYCGCIGRNRLEDRPESVKVTKRNALELR
jgi:hypothetical protein